MVARLTVATVFSFVAVAITSCDDDDACTAEGCFDAGLVLQVRQNSEPPVPQYSVELRIESEQTTIECSNASEMLQCVQGSLTEHAIVITPIGNGVELIVNRPDGIDVVGPASVGAAVIVDGETVAEEDFELSYSSREPNGPGCGSCDNQVMRFLDFGSQ